jgi:POT family proton-dependent oligopeptide transporter
MFSKCCGLPYEVTGAAKPSYNGFEDGEAIPGIIQWDDAFVNEVYQALAACKMFLFFPFFWATYSQMLTNFVSQAATMETHGIPNDVFRVINPLAIIVFIPILDRGIFPWLRTKGFSFPPATRIVCGFMLFSAAMAYAAVVKAVIYTLPPCYPFPYVRDCMQAKVPNQVHISAQDWEGLRYDLFHDFKAILDKGAT